MKSYLKKVLKVLSLIRPSDLWDLIKIITSCPIGLVLRLFKKHVWIVSEMEHTARDNGYHFFKYLRKTRPDLPIYYPIQKSSPDYGRVAELGNIIPHGSFKHHIYTWAAEADISSRTGRGLPASFMCHLFQVRGFYPFKAIFLQHGVTMNAPPFLERKRNRLDLILASSEAEADGMVKHLGYDRTQIAVTGMPRYDELNNFRLNKKQILLMPTWRFWLYPDLGRITSADREKVKNSTYVKTYCEFLKSERLKAFLNENNLTMLFFPHNQMQPFLKEFDIDPSIKIATTEEYDIQKALKESAYLITDYSSISFDFAYMKKPLAYFQFDYDEFREKHYPKGYFSYKQNGFGPVITDCDKMLDELILAYSNKFVMQDIYSQRVDEAFKYNDSLNCKRALDAIENLLKK